jgi:oxalate decarboxylase/phosphoglucose isomerase-like protein (cupin superfamily)
MKSNLCADTPFELPYPVHSLDQFFPFGCRLDPGSDGQPYQVLHMEASSSGWRFASLDVQPGALRRLHYHSNTDEIFIPATGEALLAVSSDGSIGSVRLFPLREPLLVYRNTWHEVVAKTAARLWIVENAVVDGESRTC